MDHDRASADLMEQIPNRLVCDFSAASLILAGRSVPQRKPHEHWYYYSCFTRVVPTDKAVFLPETLGGNGVPYGRCYMIVVNVGQVEVNSTDQQQEKKEKNSRISYEQGEE